MICPKHRCEVTERTPGWYACPECVNLWPRGLLEEHQPKPAPPKPPRLRGKERGDQMRAIYAELRGPGEDALVEYLRGLALPATVADVARGAYYRWRNPLTRDLPTWPEGRHGARDWLRRLEAQGRVEKTPEGWRATG